MEIENLKRQLATIFNMLNQVETHGVNNMNLLLTSMNTIKEIIEAPATTGDEE